MSAGAPPAGSRARRRLAVAVSALVLAGAAVAVESAVPGPTARSAPFVGYGLGAAASGPIALTVHDAAVADSVVVDGVPSETSGVFVVLHVTIAAELSDAPMAGELVLAGRTFDQSAKGPADWQTSTPTEGLPVTGDLVFEVDAALLASGPVVGELRVAPGLDASGDLVPQAVAFVGIGGSVEQDVVVEGLAR